MNDQSNFLCFFYQSIIRSDGQLLDEFFRFFFAWIRTQMKSTAKSVLLESVLLQNDNT